jgi:hypothetical protein
MPEGPDPQKEGSQNRKVSLHRRKRIASLRRFVKIVISLSILKSQRKKLVARSAGRLIIEENEKKNKY